MCVHVCLCATEYMCGWGLLLLHTYMCVHIYMEAREQPQRVVPQEWSTICFVVVLKSPTLLGFTAKTTLANQ